MEAPGRVELPTNGLGNRCSIHLSYGADASLSHVDFEPLSGRRSAGWVALRSDPALTCRALFFRSFGA